MLFGRAFNQKAYDRAVNATALIKVRFFGLQVLWGLKSEESLAGLYG